MSIDRLLIMKDDSTIGFHVRVCTIDNLRNCVFQEMFGKPSDDPEHTEEVRSIVGGLLADGRVEFEDGWIELRNGMEGVAEFFMAQILDARADADFEDKRRYDELKARQLAEAKYSQLRDALALAIGKGVKAANLQHHLEKAQ